MPIILPDPPDPKLALCQGDVLEGVNLAATKKIGVQEGEGGECFRTPHQLCLVLSRPCIAENERVIVVAAVETYSGKPPANFQDFEEACEFYKNIRDGRSSTDLFYLGQFPGRTGSYCARLDSIHTVQLPQKGPDRNALVAKRRIARLHPDFARDLHVRIMRAFSSLGFDDHAWHTDADLEAVVVVGKRDVTQAHAELLGLQAKLQTGLSQGFAHTSAQVGLEKQVAEAKKKYDNLVEELKPFEEELLNRKTVSMAAVTPAPSSTPLPNPGS
jgi:hypothetical protein